VHRVLKPGGTFIMSFYFWLFQHLLLLALAAKNGSLQRLGYHNQPSTTEAGADRVAIRPPVNLQSEHGPESAG